ncbi:ferrous iron transport protein B [Planctomicrobium sp. SH664]|uniref:ferrous iron transport protein B n=1 Tax=Planctomicrobium sp. SH664 TaxID=3448125 RepID=UPI003F5B5E5F
MTQPISAAPSTQQATKSLTIALIGNPNTGKSTLFNALTGGRARTGNFPGVTVEKKIGRFQHRGTDIRLVDLPGTYSLAPRSADEMVSVDVLLGRHLDLGRPDAIVCIVDASNLERNLYLFSQLRDVAIPVLLVLNMQDQMQARGIHIDLPLLQERLDVRVVATSAHRREGIDEVRDAILEVAAQPDVEPLRLFPEPFYREVTDLKSWLSARGHQHVPFYLAERMLLDVHGEAEHRESLSLQEDFSTHLAAARKRLLEQGCRIPFIETRVRYDWIRERLSGAMEFYSSQNLQTKSDRIDSWLTHWGWGLMFFVLLMFSIFQAIFTFADPIMGLVEEGQGWIAGLVEAVLAPGILRSLIVDGVIAGVGSVVIFLPQIVLLFLFVAILEDCGYMARAAFLMDKLMTRVGLSGKSFLPLMSSFACAIPGVMATRVIENRRDRLTTLLVAPLMSCSARIPVYMLMIAAFIPPIAWLGGLVNLQVVTLFAMYCVGALIAIPVAWLLKKTLLKGETPPFVMELPSYKWPSPRIVFDRVYDRAKAFLVEAGTLIFAMSVLVWGAGYFPGDHKEQHAIQAEVEQIEAAGTAEDDAAVSARLEELQARQQELSSTLIENSFLGRAGKFIEPVVEPLGWDWRIGVGAIASFPAREVIISTLGTIFSLGGDVEDGDSGLQSALQGATWPDGKPLFTIPVAVSVMVFFALCAQCGATLLVIKRETNSWRWPIFTFTYMTALAYVAALVVYQVGTRLL